MRNSDGRNDSDKADDFSRIEAGIQSTINESADSVAGTDKESDMQTDRKSRRAAVNSGRVRMLSTFAAICVALLCGSSLLAQDAGPEPVSLNNATGSVEEVSSGIPTHPMEIFRQMKYWLIPFVVASVISVWFTIERLVVLRRSRVIPRAFVEPFLDRLRKGSLDSSTAKSLCEKNESPIAAVFSHAVHKWGRPSVEVEQAIIDGGERQVAQLRRHLRVINGVATVTPLLGLLGTVVGMIQAFNDIASAGAMGKADQLAAGIAMALLTTAFGLAIAIPSLIMYMYLSGRVEVLVMEMDELSQKVVRHVCGEGLAARPAPRARQRPAPAETPEPVA